VPRTFSKNYALRMRHELFAVMRLLAGRAITLNRPRAFFPSEYRELFAEILHEGHDYLPFCLFEDEEGISSPSSFDNREFWTAKAGAT
jgi:hypothetical protein